MTSIGAPIVETTEKNRKVGASQVKVQVNDRRGAGRKVGSGQEPGDVRPAAKVPDRLGRHETHKVSDQALAAAAQAGLSAEAVLDVLLECAFATLAGLIDNLAGHVELDAFIAPQAW